MKDPINVEIDCPGCWRLCALGISHKTSTRALYDEDQEWIGSSTSYMPVHGEELCTDCGKTFKFPALQAPRSHKINPPPCKACGCPYAIYAAYDRFCIEEGRPRCKVCEKTHKSPEMYDRVALEAAIQPINFTYRGPITRPVQVTDPYEFLPEYTDDKSEDWIEPICPEYDHGYCQ